MAPVINDVVSETWNAVLFDKFVRSKHLLIGGSSGDSDEALAPYAKDNGVWAPSSTWFITAGNFA